MHPALQGLLLGIGIAAVMLIFEYVSANRSAAERAKRMAKKKEWNQDERARVQGMVRFSLVLPFGIAGIYWLIARWL